MALALFEFLARRALGILHVGAPDFLEIGNAACLDPLLHAVTPDAISWLHAATADYATHLGIRQRAVVVAVLTCDIPANGLHRVARHGPAPNRLSALGEG